MKASSLKAASGESRQRGRLRAFLGLGIGAVAVLAVVGFRFAMWGQTAGPTPSGLAPSGPELPAFSLALAVVALLSAWIARPERDTLVTLGLLPFAGIFGCFIPLWALFDPSIGLTLVLEGLAAAGGFALVLSTVRLFWAGLLRGPWDSPIDKKRKVRVRRPGDKKRSQVAVASLVRGDEFELSPGEDVPVDSTIVEGSGFVDESLLFATELPSPKRPGDFVFAGTSTSIPEVLLRAEGTMSESLVAVRDGLLRQVVFELSRPGRAAKIGSGLAAGLGVGVAVLGVTHAGPGELEGWVPVVAGASLASLAAASILRRLRLIGDLAEVCRSRGVIVSRAKDLLALANVRRWQIDPHLLAAPGPVEAVAFSDVPPSHLLRVAEALISDDPSPELLSVRAALKDKQLEPIHGAALRRDQAVYHGTVLGERWYVGPPSALELVERIELDSRVLGPIEFLREKGLITWALGRRDVGIVGAVGIGIGVNRDAGLVAEALQATLLPGLPDTTRRAIAAAAGLKCDGPPLGARDASILPASAPPPSAGLRIRVVDPIPGLEVFEDGAPRLFAPALPRFGEAALGARRFLRRAWWEMALFVALPGLLALALLWARLLGSVSGALIGCGAAWLSARRRSGSEEGARAEAATASASAAPKPAPEDPRGRSSARRG